MRTVRRHGSFAFLAAGNGDFVLQGTTSVLSMISDAGVDEPSALLESSGRGLASPLAEDYALAAFHYYAAASPLGAEGCRVRSVAALGAAGGPCGPRVSCSGLQVRGAGPAGRAARLACPGADVGVVYGRDVFGVDTTVSLRDNLPNPTHCSGNHRLVSRTCPKKAADEGRERSFALAGSEFYDIFADSLNQGP